MISGIPRAADFHSSYPESQLDFAYFCQRFHVIYLILIGSAVSFRSFWLFHLSVVTILHVMHVMHLFTDSVLQLILDHFNGSCRAPMNWINQMTPQDLKMLDR